VEEDDVALVPGGVGPRGGGEAVCGDEGGLDVVQNVGPYLTNVYKPMRWAMISCPEKYRHTVDLRWGTQARVTEGVDGSATFINPLDWK
jgi:hypothetical protein